LGALGVFYGDIGTSPLCPVRECFNGPHAIVLNDTSILGVASLILWSLTVVVSAKYVGLILKADNRGEGGIFALLGLILGQAKHLRPRLRSAVITGGIFGAALRRRCHHPGHLGAFSHRRAGGSDQSGQAGRRSADLSGHRGAGSFLNQDPLRRLSPFIEDYPAAEPFDGSIPDAR
jgi:hypothetical protein